MERPLGYSIVYGLLGGLIGGAVYGVILTNMDVMALVGSLAGFANLWAGWVVHMTLSMFFGVVLGFIVANIRGHPVLLGAAWAAVVWLFGYMMAFPYAIGQPILDFDANAWYALLGHIVYGVITGAMVFAFLRPVEEKRRAAARA